MTRRVRLIVACAVAAMAAAPAWASPAALSLAEGGPPQEQSAPRWVLFPGEDGAMLSQADGAGRETMLICQPGSGRIYVSNSAFTREDTSLTLTSGDARGTYPLAPEGPDDGSGERKFQIAEIGAGEAVVTAFRRTGRMTMEAGDERISLATSSDDQATVERFLTYCG